MTGDGSRGQGKIVGRAEQERLWRLAVTGDRDAADALVRCCLPKIRRLAGQYGRNATPVCRGAYVKNTDPWAVEATVSWAARACAGAESDDLEQIGMMQAFKCIKYYRPDRGSFFNYAISAASKKMVESLGRARRGLGPSLGDAAQYIVPARNDPDRSERVERVEAALSRLNPLERTVVELREGYGRGRGYGVEATARRLGMSVKRVEQLHRSAVNRLSDELADLIH